MCNEQEINQAIAELGTFESRQSLTNDWRFKQTNKIWNRLGLNASRRVGSVMAMIDNLKPKTYLEWQYYYLSFRKDNFNEVIPFEHEAEILAQYAQLDFATAIRYAFHRVLDQTYQGYTNEQNAITEIRAWLKKYAPQSCYIVEHANGYYDRVLGIDVRIWWINPKDNKAYEICGIQLKPKSFLQPQKNWFADADRQNKTKQIKYAQTVHAPAYYWFYEDLQQEKKPMLSVKADGTPVPLLSNLQAA